MRRRMPTIFQGYKLLDKWVMKHDRVSNHKSEYPIISLKAQDEKKMKAINHDMYKTSKIMLKSLGRN